MTFSVATTFLALVIVVVVSAFPQVSTVTEDSRVPIIDQERCGENELLYPIEGTNDWECDCAPAYVFYPPKDKCYLVYRKGPCAANQYIIFKKDAEIPSCEPNPCKKDRMVQFNGECHPLKKSAPCSPFGGGTLGVNASTLELQCLKTVNALSLFTGSSLARRCHKRGCRNIS